MKALREQVGAEVAKVVVGQHQTIDLVMIGLACRGHVLMEGPPGVAKTLIANAIARSLGLTFRRAQFTPDMLPTDLTGTMALEGGQLGNLTFRPGPVFTNVLLADEINRTPPKTQAALLEAMGEGQVTVDGVSRRLDDPFLVMATQNPIEFEGTYPLPEAQLDRFLVKATMSYPTEAEELAMLRLPRSGATSASLDAIVPVAGLNVVGGAIAALRAEVDATGIHDRVLEYALGVVRATRSVPAVQLGASPRAAVHLVSASKAMARLQGRDFVTPDDVAVLAPYVLAHRILLRYEAASDRYTPNAAITTALTMVPVPR
jgi:MoxR-like ATPase